MPRTDNDTWDLATGVGTTATGVAALRALASTRPSPLIVDPFARPLVEAVGLPEFIDMADGRPVEGGVDLRVAADAMAIRTQFFDVFVQDGIAAGVRQVVILAAGLDTRGYRLEVPAGVTVFEIDQPGVIDFKVRTLAGLGAESTVCSIGIDLRDDWPSALRDSGFDTGHPTAWLAEGLLGYLPPAAQDALFDAITELSAPASRVATDWHPGRAVLDGEVAELLFDGDRSDVGEYLTGRGWDVDTHTAKQRFAANGMAFRREDAIAGLCDAHFTVATR